MITSVWRNGTVCPYSHHQHLEKRITVYKRRKCVSHTLSLQQPNLNALHVNTLHICACGHQGKLVLEQARRVSNPSCICHHEVGSTPQEQISPRSSWHLLEGPWPVCKKHPCTLCIEWGRLYSPHSPPDSPSFIAFPTAGGCRGDSLLFQSKSSRRGHMSH